MVTSCRRATRHRTDMLERGVSSAVPRYDKKSTAHHFSPIESPSPYPSTISLLRKYSFRIQRAFDRTVKGADVRSLLNPDFRFESPISNVAGELLDHRHLVLIWGGGPDFRDSSRTTNTCTGMLTTKPRVRHRLPAAPCKSTNARYSLAHNSPRHSTPKDLLALRSAISMAARKVPCATSST